MMLLIYLFITLAIVVLSVLFYYNRILNQALDNLNKRIKDSAELMDLKGDKFNGNSEYNSTIVYHYVRDDFARSNTNWNSKSN